MRAVVAFVLLAFAAAPAHGQTIWTRPYQPNQIAVEWIAPAFEDDDVSGITSATFLDLTYSLTDNVELVGELPIAYYAADTESGSTSTSAVGNPYLGVGLSSTRTPFLLELGARLPAAPDNEASFAGQFADAGRGSAFRHDAFTASALLNWRFPLGRYTSLRIRTGGTLAQYPDSTDNTERDFRFRYSAQLWRVGDPLLVGLTAAGRISFSAPDALATTTRHTLAGSVMLDFSTVQPGLLLGIALDDDVRDVASFFVGLTLSTSYGQ